MLQAVYVFDAEAGVSGLFWGKNAPHVKTQTPNAEASLNKKLHLHSGHLEMK